jgi:hypothetical protein
MIAATILSWALAAALDPQPPTEFNDDLAHVEMIRTGDDVQVVAYDSAGETIAVLAIWTDEDRSHIASDFTDGYEEIVIVGDEVVHRDSSLAPGVAGTRARAMLDLVAPHDPQEGKVGCVLTILTSVAACSPPSVATTIGAFSCPPSVYLALCECAEFLGKEPPEEWC